MRKKVLAVLLAASLAASFTACGEKQDQDTKETGTAATDETTGATDETEAEVETIPYVSAFDYEDIEKYVKLGEYKNLEVALVDTTVTDEDNENDLQSKLDEYNASYPEYEQITDRTVESGDVINLDYSGTVDGETEPFDGGTAEGQTLTIGSGQFVPGFEDALIGAKVGEEVDVKITFPDSYTETLAGKPATFKCTVNYIQGEQILKELNDAFIEEYTSGEYKTLDEFRVYNKTELETTAAENAENTYMNDAWAQIIEGSEFGEEPTELIEYINKDTISQYEQSLAMYGMDMASYLETINMTQEDFDAEMLEAAKAQAKSALAICAIIKAENKLLSDDEVDKKITELAEKYGYSDESLRQYYDIGLLRDTVYKEMVQEIVLESVVPVEKPAETEETETAAE